MVSIRSRSYKDGKETLLSHNISADFLYSMMEGMFFWRTISHLDLTVFPQLSFIVIGSTEFLLEGDVMIPRTKTAMKCFAEAYTCLWPKSEYGTVIVPFILSQKYGGFQFFQGTRWWYWTVHVNTSLSGWYYWFNTFTHNFRRLWDERDSGRPEGLWMANLHSIYPTY